MLIKDLKLDKQLQEELKDEDTCELCAIHNAAERIIPSIECPECHTYLDMEDFSLEIVGEFYGEDDEWIQRVPVIKCPNCHNEIALFPQKIIHHYGHDVRCTGGKHAIPNFSSVDLALKIKPSIEQFLRRNDVTADNLAMWVANDFESYFKELLIREGIVK